MTLEEKARIAWIALDGLLFRNFFTAESYESPEYEDIMKQAFKPYAGYLKHSEPNEDNLPLLLHMQNLAEQTFQNDKGHFGKMNPIELAFDIVGNAQRDLNFSNEYTLFSSFERWFKAFSQ